MNKYLLIPGLGIMLVVAWVIFFWPDPDAKQWFALLIIFIIGLGLTIAGSPDPQNNKHKRQPGVDRPYGIDQSGDTEWRGKH